MTDGIELDESVKDIVDKQNITESVSTRNLKSQTQTFPRIFKKFPLKTTC